MCLSVLDILVSRSRARAPGQVAEPGSGAWPGQGNAGSPHATVDEFLPERFMFEGSRERAVRFWNGVSTYQRVL